MMFLFKRYSPRRDRADLCPIQQNWSKITLQTVLIIPWDVPLRFGHLYGHLQAIESNLS